MTDDWDPLKYDLEVFPVQDRNGGPDAHVDLPDEQYEALYDYLDTEYNSRDEKFSIDDFEPVTDDVYAVSFTRIRPGPRVSNWKAVVEWDKEWEILAVEHVRNFLYR
ncbi:hypothetical protein BRC64_06640 [Halobacteriales archaeon QH_10_67_22]|nr:MAG: hypothetical protein BRC64_06640 [Halobacteriales archaeon QH_10_67_22]